MTRIIHITDLHFWHIVRNPLLLCNKRILGNLNLLLRRQHYVHQERAQSFIDLFPSLEADALLIGGDLTTTATEAEYRQAAVFVNTLAQFGIPVYMTAGNHDLYTFESKRQQRFEKHFGNRLEKAGIPSLKFLPGGTPLLIVPTARPNLLSSRGHISNTQLQDTQTLLEQAPEGPLVVLAHYPVLSTPSHHSNYMRQLGNGALLHRLLGDTSRPILYLAGHVHVFSHTRDPQFPNLEQITSSALFYEKQHHPGGFTEIVYTDGEVAVHPWQYNNGWKRTPESCDTTSAKSL
ncbi:MAG: metallophosphoesterase [Candidatus Hydrogenedentes bacterium]|nr:metallophosphoesterase [Candidatus Hydrogenedentota bacterium]